MSARDLLPYLSDGVLLSIPDHPQELRPPIGRSAPGAVVFCDIVGFTPMSEALGALGSAGTEELSRLLNGFFGRVLDVAARHGGDVSHFSGDAVSIVFEQDDVRAALRCAMALQAVAQRHGPTSTSAGPFRVELRVGLGCGVVRTVVLGSRDRLVAYVCGGALERAVAAESLSGPGDVMAHAAALPAGRARAQPADNPYILVRAGDVPAARAADRRSDRPSRDATRCEAVLPLLVHPALAAAAGEQLDAFADQHRRVTTAFVALATPTDAALPEVQEQVASLLDAVQRHGGHVRQLDAVGGALTAVLLFGAPVTFDDDAALALGCALELRGLLRPAPRIGVTTGRVFCGHIGSPLRREYAAIGDAVNCAARLMQAARPGQVLVDAATRAASRTPFAWDELPPLRVKGKEGRVAVAALRGLARRPAPVPRDLPPLLGRGPLLGRMEEALRDASAGRGRVLGLCGPAGVGKSRVAAAVAELAQEHGFTVLRGAAEQFRSATPYLPWRQVVRSLLGLPGEGAVPADAIRAGLHALDPSLTLRWPLLGDVLGVEVAEDPLTSGLSPGLRAEMARALVVDCLGAATSRNPALLVQEDCHWMDPLSRELLSAVARAAPSLPLVLVPSHRPEGSAPLAALEGTAGVEEVALGELDSGAAAELVRDRCRRQFGQEADDAFVAAVLAQAGGNPLFAEAVVGLVAERGAAPTAEFAATAAHVPDSLSGTVLARVDALAPLEQVVLRLGSVLGASFPTRWLTGGFPGVLDARHAERALDVLHARGLLATGDGPSGTQQVFTHAMTRQVAYDGLTHAAREGLHDTVGCFLETQAWDDADLLAHHFGRSRNLPKQRTHFRRAGDLARSRYANEAAVDYYERLRGLITPAELPEVMLRLGEVRELTGDYPAAERCYRGSLVAADPRVASLASTALGGLLAVTQSFERGLGWVEQGRARAEAAQDRDALCRALELLAWMCWNLGRMDRALEVSGRHHDVAAAAGDLAGVAAASSNAALVHWTRGELDEAALLLERSREAAAEAGDLRLVVHACNNAAGVQLQRGDPSRCLDLLREGCEVAQRIGYREQVAVLTGNEAELRLQLGDASGALAASAESIRLLAEMGATTEISMQVTTLAAALAACGRIDEADLAFRASSDRARALARPQEMCQVLQAHAEHCASTGRTDDAARLAAEAVQAASAAGEASTSFRARLLALRCDLATGRTALRETIAAMQRLARDAGDDGERADVLASLWEADRQREGDRRTAIDLSATLLLRTRATEHRRRLARLGAEAPPVEPGAALPSCPYPAPGDVRALLARLGPARSLRAGASVPAPGGLVEAGSGGGRAR